MAEASGCRHRAGPGQVGKPGHDTAAPLDLQLPPPPPRATKPALVTPATGSHWPRSATEPHHYHPQHTPAPTLHATIPRTQRSGCGPPPASPLPPMPVSSPLPPLPASHQALWIQCPSHLPDPSAFPCSHSPGPNPPFLSWPGLRREAGGQRKSPRAEQALGAGKAFPWPRDLKGWACCRAWASGPSVHL